MKKLVIKPGKTIRQKVYEHLRETILNGEINPARDWWNPILPAVSVRSERRKAYIINLL